MQDVLFSHGADGRVAGMRGQTAGIGAATS